MKKVFATLEITAQQAAAAQEIATFLCYTEVYKKAKAAGNAEAAEAAIDIKLSLNAGGKESAGRQRSRSSSSRPNV